MNFTFQGIRVSGIQLVLPARSVAFEDEIHQYNFSAEQSLRLKRIMGYGTHRIVDTGTCISDLIVYGIEHLISTNRVERSEIDALIVVSQSPDHFMPPTSNLIQGRARLGQETYCLDISQGCAGFIIGLIESCGLFSQPSVNRVLLANADVLSRKTSKQDRNSWPLIGDGAALTLLERDSSAPPIKAICKMDGSRAEALMIPAGGFRRPSDPSSAVMTTDETGNSRSADHLVMKGDAVFNFVQREIPPLIDQILEASGWQREQVEWFLFHQPNRFMLQKLAEKLRIPYERMPSEVVERFGNGSGITIPLSIWTSIRDVITLRSSDVCLAGFGVGLTWAAMTMTLGPLAYCNAIDFPDPSQATPA